MIYYLFVCVCMLAGVCTRVCVLGGGDGGGCVCVCVRACACTPVCVLVHLYVRAMHVV